MVSTRRTLALTSAITAALSLLWAPSAQALIGGQPATGPYSFMASLQRPESARPDGHVCGASLISSRWVVTAAHCALGAVDGWKVRIGSPDTTKGGELISVKRAVPYAQGGAGSDIALLQLAEPAHAKPVTVAGASPKPGTRVRLLGWGQTCEPEGPACWPTALGQLNTTLLPDASCDDSGIVDATELCVSDVDGEGGPGNYDSGGPALVEHGGTWELAGATSGSNGAPGTAPTVYTDVTAFRGWIRKTTAARG
jgi:secreted trypsin-like serine protease